MQSSWVSSESSIPSKDNFVDDKVRGLLLKCRNYCRDGNEINKLDNC